MAVAKNRKTKISLKEFRAWLDGVEDVQPDDWAPNKEQWTKIRQQIDRIDDKMDIENQDAPTTTRQQPVQPNNNFVPQQQFPSAFNVPHPMDNVVIVENPNLRLPGNSGYQGAGVVATAGIPIDLNNPPPIGTEFV